MRTWAVEAARLILDQIELHPDGPFKRVVVPPALRIRASCGAPVRAESAGTPVHSVMQRLG